MILTRRDMTSLTFSATVTCGLTASRAEAQPTMFPARALHNPRDALFIRAASDPKRHHVKDDAPHKEGPHNPVIALDHSWQKHDKGFPRAGATVIIDRQGNWSFSALFDPFNPAYAPGSGGMLGPQGLRAVLGAQGRNAALVFALQSSLGYTMTWAAGGWASINGLSWQKQGHDPIVKDLWPDVVKGHRWYGTAVFGPLISTVQEQQAAGGAKQEGNSALGDVASALGTVGAVILSLF